MSAHKMDEFDPRLLDLHLGQLSDDECAALQRELVESPVLAGQHAALQSVFAALELARPAAVPAGLADRCCERLRTMPLTAVSAAAAAERPRLRLHFGSYRDLVAVAAMIVFLIGVGVPGLLHVRERHQRVACSANLARVGAGIQQYASIFADSLPFAGWGPNSTWQQSQDNPRDTVPNRRHVYPLLHEALIADPRTLLCPSRSGVPMPREQIRARHDFLESRNLGYAYFNMAGVRPSVRSDANLPIFGDDNPLFEDGFLLCDLARMGFERSTQGNSRAHGGAGQNVVTLSGAVKWSTTPNCGVGGDNIWTLDGVRDYTGVEGPARDTDTHLLK